MVPTFLTTRRERVHALFSTGVVLSVRYLAVAHLAPLLVREVLCTSKRISAGCREGGGGGLDSGLSRSCEAYYRSKQVRAAFFYIMGTCMSMYGT